MERIDKLTIEALNWLRFVLNQETSVPTVTDWAALYRFADKQKIIGVCNPMKYDVKIGIETLSIWISSLQQIMNRCASLNKRVGELYSILENADFKCCILKGQGNAEMYPEPLLRMSGDIDVWIDADEQTVYKFVRERYPEAAKSYKHIKFPVFEDVPVDAHFTPLTFYRPKYHRRLQHWIRKNKLAQFEHRIHLTGIEKEISVPTLQFNAVYQLGHMLIHLYDEGIGLRHLIDYFYVLKNLNFSVEERKEFINILTSVGMLRFAKAVMWIEKEILGLSVEHCIVDSNEKFGRQLLDDVLEGGNFGKYSQRYKGKSGFYWMGIIEAKRIVALSDLAPLEATFCLLRKIRTAVKHVMG